MWDEGIAIVLAQEKAPEGKAPEGDGKAAPVSPFSGMLFPIVAIAVLWYFILLRPQRREQQRRNQLLDTLKKNDRVVTIGGVIGTVANISDNGKEVVLKVEDNARIRFQRTAIQSVLKDDSQGAEGTGAPGLDKPAG